MRKNMLSIVAAAGFVLGVASHGNAWNAHGHRTIARLAVDGLPKEMPAFLREPEVVARIAEQSCEPDRWRSTRRLVIGHEMNSEHYLDVEDLDQFGLTLETVPRLRYEYVRSMILAKQAHPEKAKPYDASKDLDKSKEWPGFLLHGIDEHFALLQSSFHTMRVLEAINEASPEGREAREPALRQERENIIHEMGILSHLIGDTAQPLHTTQHHHGWVGDNPNGYTKDNGFHSYIDGRILAIHKLDFDALRPGMKYERHVNPADPWDDAMAHVKRSFDKVEPLYQLQKSGELTRETGRDFISERLRDGAETLNAFYIAAWHAAKPSESDIANFIKYDESKATSAAPKNSTPVKKE